MEADWAAKGQRLTVGTQHNMLQHYSETMSRSLYLQTQHWWEASALAETLDPRSLMANYYCWQASGLILSLSSDLWPSTGPEGVMTYFWDISTTLPPQTRWILFVSWNFKMAVLRFLILTVILVLFLIVIRLLVVTLQYNALFMVFTWNKVSPSLCKKKKKKTTTS